MSNLDRKTYDDEYDDSDNSDDNDVTVPVIILPNYLRARQVIYINVSAMRIIVYYFVQYVSQSRKNLIWYHLFPVHFSAY